MFTEKRPVCFWFFKLKLSSNFGGFGTKVGSTVYKNLKYIMKVLEIIKDPLNPGQTVLLSDNDVNDISIQRGCIFLHVICQLLFFILLEVWALYGAKKIIFMLHLVSHGYPKIQSISLHCCHVLFCNPKMLWHFFMGGLWTSFLEYRVSIIDEWIF